MKKSISVILMISFILLTLIGCNNTDTPADDTTDDNNNSVPAFVDPINDYDKVDDSSTDGFVIKSKKYDYEDNNVVIMNVENQSENNYTVTVDMTYYDDGGNEITKESQSFEGFSANWQKYFMFKPDRAFSSYEYKLTTENFSGECYGKNFNFEHTGVREGRVSLGLDENGNSKGLGKGILSDIVVRYEFSEILDFWVTPIFFDPNGEIYFIDSLRKVGSKPPYADYTVSSVLIVGTEESVDFPDELNGDTNGILILNNIGIGITIPEY